MIRSLRSLMDFTLSGAGAQPARRTLTDAIDVPVLVSVKRVFTAHSS
jgi:hypothetical protein